MSLHSFCMQSHKTLTLDTTSAFMSCALNAFDINHDPSFYINLFYTLFFLFLRILWHLAFDLVSKKVSLKHTNTHALPGLQKHRNEKKPTFSGI